MKAERRRLLERLDGGGRRGRRWKKLTFKAAEAVPVGLRSLPMLAAFGGAVGERQRASSAIHRLSTKRHIRGGTLDIVAEDDLVKVETVGCGK